MSAWPINPPSSGTLAFSLRLVPYCGSCPCDRHDLFLPSIPASLQTLGRCECVATCASAPLGLRIISPLTFYLIFLGAIWTFDKNLAPIFPSHLSTVAPQIFSDPRPPSQRTYTLWPCFQVPTDSRGLWGPHEQYLRDPWAPGHAVLCVWKPE